MPVVPPSPAVVRTLFSLVYLELFFLLCIAHRSTRLRFRTSQPQSHGGGTTSATCRTVSGGVFCERWGRGDRSVDRLISPSYTHRRVLPSSPLPSSHSRGRRKVPQRDRARRLGPRPPGDHRGPPHQAHLQQHGEDGAVVERGGGVPQRTERFKAPVVSTVTNWCRSQPYPTPPHPTPSTARKNIAEMD